MTDKKPELAVSYEGGAQQTKDVEVGKQEHDDAIRGESDRLEALVDRVEAYLVEDRLRVWRELSARQVERTREAQRADKVGPELGVLPDAVAMLARALFDLWREMDTRDIDGLTLFDGLCVEQPHGWFVAIGDPRLLGPKYNFLIDPAPRGLRMDGPLIAMPFSPFQLAYAGLPVPEPQDG